MLYATYKTYRHENIKYDKNKGIREKNWCSTSKRISCDNILPDFFTIKVSEKKIDARLAKDVLAIKYCPISLDLIFSIEICITS